MISYMQIKENNDIRLKKIEKEILLYIYEIGKKIILYEKGNFI